MKRQYLRLFSFLIGITFIISGILFTFVNNYKEEKKKKVAEEDAIADEIVDIYKAFYDKEVELSDYRDEVLKSVKDFSVFFTEMPDGYGNVYPMVEKYEVLVT